jgi:hypothetical protein
MKPLETTEENIRRLINDPKFKLPYYAECCETNKTVFSKCEKCQIDYCSNECKKEAFLLYHQVLCLGEHRFNPEHPINLLLDAWKYVVVIILSS